MTEYLLLFSIFINYQTVYIFYSYPFKYLDIHIRFTSSSIKDKFLHGSKIFLKKYNLYFFAGNSREESNSSSNNFMNNYEIMK